MISILLGTAAIIFFVFNIHTSIRAFLHLQHQAGQVASLEAAIWFIAACICFK